jgi:PAS domain S-box-containing protein
MTERDDELARLRDRVEVLEREASEARGTGALLRSLLENAPDLVARVALDGTLLYLNRVVPGVVLEEALGRSALDFIAPDSREVAQRTFDQVARTGAPGAFDCKALGPNGATSDYSTTVSPIKEAERVVALTLIARDVSTQRATERALRESDEKLRLAIGATGVGLWSWDFKTGAGRSRATDRKPLAIEELVERTVRMCRSMFDSRITIELPLAPEPPLIVADGGQIEQALLNVLINARDAVQASPEPRPRTIRVRIEAASGRVVVRVEDNGVGMDTATRRRIFEPFFTTKEVGRGTGLGLATTYAIVQDHGGTVECESTVGVGTTFTLSFPAGPETQRGQERAGAAPGVAGGSERVLVVDDEALVRSTVVRTLRGAGYEVVEAEDGEAALRVLTGEGERFDLVLLDESMSKLSGRGVLAAMREKEIRVPVIGWTAHVGVMEGVRTVLNKPVTSASLLRAVREVLDA